MQFLTELKRRNVFRVAAAYLVTSWLLLQVIDVVGPILGLPDAFARYVLFLLAVGIIPAVVFSWVYELTPEGVRRESEVKHSESITPRTGHRLDRVIMVVLALAVGLLLFDKFMLRAAPETVDTERTQAGLPDAAAPETPAPPTESGRRSVAVLPFVARSNGPDDDYFADGLTEEIINALAQLPDLLVTARTSAFHFKDLNLPVDEIARRLGVDHLVEGSVRRAGEQLRISAQLIRAGDGFNLWSENYDRRTQDTFEVQEDIAEKIATALDVVLNAESREAMRRVGVRNVEAFTEYQKGRELFDRAHNNVDLISLLRQANGPFEKVVALAPATPDAYLSMNDLYSHILMDQSSGKIDGNITGQDVRDAPAALQRNYDLAVKYARNRGQRLSAELDRAYVLGDWAGLSMKADQWLADPGYDISYWAQMVSYTLGSAEAARLAFERRAEANPMLRMAWVHVIRTHLWQGDIEGALRAGDRAARILNNTSVWQSPSGIQALVAGGRETEARQLANGISASAGRIIALFMIAALEGDEERAAELQQQFLSEAGLDDTTTLTMEALRGNRNEANRLAGIIDRRPFGHLGLMLSVLMCACGAPFDLEATPVLAGKFAESGLVWPPPTPLNFPLKNW